MWWYFIGSIVSTFFSLGELYCQDVLKRMQLNHKYAVLKPCMLWYLSWLGLVCVQKFKQACTCLFFFSFSLCVVYQGVLGLTLFLWFDLQESLQLSLSLIPPNALVGLITFGRMVRHFDVDLDPVLCYGLMQCLILPSIPITIVVAMVWHVTSHENNDEEGFQVMILCFVSRSSCTSLAVRDIPRAMCSGERKTLAPRISRSSWD